jgi:hypothetical protein
LINPVVVKAKILLQQIWLLKLDWDKPVPEEIATSWKLFVDELTELNKFRIPRKLIISNLPINLIELHGFADASSKAYGAAVYVKATDVAGNSSVTLLCAKSRVAPIKKVTLPRLELNAAVVLCALMSKINESLNLKSTPNFIGRRMSDIGIKFKGVAIFQSGTMSNRMTTRPILSRAVCFRGN